MGFQNDNDVEQAIRTYLPEIIHMSLATSANNRPWVCEVHFVFDNDLNLYFRSKPSRRHSKEIAANKNVAGNIVKQHIVGQKPRGVYFEGIAELLNNVGKNDEGYKLYCERFGTDESIIEEAKEDDGHKFYKISVKKFYLFDTIESSPSKKYELDWKK